MAPTEAEIAERGEALHLARVEVAFDVDDEDDAASSILSIAARFAEARGLDESKVRARVDIPLLPQDVLEPGECVPSDRLVTAVKNARTDRDEEPELELIDVGDVSVHIDRTNVDVPVNLLPDLLPYMSGVEYAYISETASSVLAEGPRSVRLTSSGSAFADIPAFTVTTPVPMPLELEVPGAPASAGLGDEDTLALRWQPAGDAEDTVVIRMSASTGSDPSGEEIICLYPDAGDVQLDLEHLRGLGLGASGDMLHVAVGRTTQRTFDVGPFENAELVVEIRDQVSVALP